MENKNLFGQWRQMALRIVILMSIYSVARIVFIINNKDLFPNLEGETIACLIGGMRFDLAAICLSNVIFILASILPFKFTLKKWYRLIIKGLYYVINVPLLLVMFCDIEYYRFTYRHSTLELLSFRNEFVQLVGQFVVDYWYFLILMIVLLMSVVWLFKQTEKLVHEPPKIIPGLAIVAITFGLTALAARGGFQTKPIVTIQAIEGIHVSNGDIVVNTPFTFLHSILQPNARELTYFTDNEELEYFNYCQSLSHPDSLTFPGKNIVLIIMESFSQDHMAVYGALNSRTPFLDSLARQAMLFPNMMANGFRSVDGLAATLGGIPNLSNQNFITSKFQANQFDGLGTVLSREGYETAFYHGGLNGTLHFDHFTKRAGFEHYFGCDEYANMDDFDGTWGIYDIPYFEYASGKMSELQEPFCASLYSLSAHHPWKLPKEFKGAYPQETYDSFKMVRYSDEALRRFFKLAQNEPWFENTIFLITSDHQGKVEKRYYQWMPGFFQIPLLVYAPGENLPHINERLIQQIDIAPGVLGLLGVDKPGAFGHHFFVDDQQYTYHFYRDNFIITDDNYLLVFDGEEVVEAWHWDRSEHFERQVELQAGPDMNRLVNRLKALIQEFDARLKHNRLTYCE